MGRFLPRLRRLGEWFQKPVVVFSWLSIFALLFTITHDDFQSVRDDCESLRLSYYDKLQYARFNIIRGDLLALKLDISDSRADGMSVEDVAKFRQRSKDIASDLDLARAQNLKLLSDGENSLKEVEALCAKADAGARVPFLIAIVLTLLAGCFAFWAGTNSMRSSNG